MQQRKQRWTVEDIVPVLNDPYCRNVDNLRAMVNLFTDVEMSDNSTLLEVKDVLLDKIRSKNEYADLVCNQIWAASVLHMQNEVAERLKDFVPRFGLRKR